MCESIANSHRVLREKSQISCLKSGVSYLSLGTQKYLAVSCILEILTWLIFELTVINCGSALTKSGIYSKN